MELKRDDIIKALECLLSTDYYGKEFCERKVCSYSKCENCLDDALRDALSLIKELTDELTECYTNKAKLTEENAYLKHIELEAMRSAANSYKMHNEKLTEENERLRASAIDYRNIPYIVADTRADTVRKMQGILENRIHNKISYHGWFIKETVIAKVVKEMLEAPK